ncbi:MAG: M13 family metallopeptidase [Proteobacteria bacterium]|nr:M13 family metallopeptidase [Pseudomonadota bacterium]
MRKFHPSGHSARPGFLALILTLATATSAARAATVETAPGEAAPSRGGVDVAAMDRTVRPGDDFYRYANGGWLRSAQIPPDRSSWGPAAQLTELTSHRTEELIRGAGADAKPGTNAARIADYYAAFMDERQIERRGLAPLQAQLRQIDAIADRKALARALGATLRADVDVFNSTQLHTANLLGVWVAQDLDDPAHYAVFLLQGGLTMPDRDYYLDPGAKMAETRAQFRQHVERVLTLAHLPQPHEAAARVVELEGRLAAVHASRESSEDVLKGNNRWQRSELPTRAPGIDWDAFLDAAHLAAQRSFVVWQPAAVSGIAALVGSEPLQAWKDFLRFHLVEQYSPYLPAAFAAEHFAFHGKVLDGTPQQAPRWKRAVAATDQALGEAVGQLYVNKYFPPAAKAQVQAMVRQLLAAFGRRIDHLEWMAPQTRAVAKAKLAALRVGVGYPDHWRDYSGLVVKRADALGNVQRAELFEYQLSLAKVGKPVDRSEWVMNPQLVNAVNLPAMNALNFPAAILQAPWFDPAASAAANYGGIGATIGHEISHSFDDQGAMFDAQGRLRNWWTPQDLAHFRAAGAALAAQFSAYRPFPDLAVNGKQTLSENIADVAGLSAAYDAWEAALAGQPAPRSGAFSGQQEFFISYAQSWQQKVREAALRRRIVTDGHAPDEYRADTVRNLDAWYRAFDVQPGEHLYLTPQQRVHVW